MKQYLAAALLVAMTGQTAFAQAVMPMRAVATSITDEFAVRLTVGNPYSRAVDFKILTFDENFNPIEAAVNPRTVKVGARDTRQVVARFSFNGQDARKVRVCAEGFFSQNKNTAVRTQVCGRYLGQRVGSQQ